MGGNNGRFRWLGDLLLRCPDAVLFLSRQDTTIVPEKSPPSGRETRLRRPRRRGSEEIEEEEEEDRVAFQNGGGIISGSRKRQRIRVAVSMAQDTSPLRRVGKEEHNGKMPCNVPGFIITLFSHWEAIHDVIASRPDLRHGKRLGLCRQPPKERATRIQSRDHSAFSLPSDSLHRRKGNLLS